MAPSFRVKFPDSILDILYKFTSNSSIGSTVAHDRERPS